CFFFQAEDGIRDRNVTGVQTCALPISFSTVDGLIGAARGRGMRLVLLWFGSWKNSMSCYAPAWVKTDPERFPRSRDSRGRALEIDRKSVVEGTSVDLSG